MQTRKVSIFGSTGSVGCSTLSVIEHCNGLDEMPSFDVDVLAAGQDTETLAQQAIAFGASKAVVADESRLDDLRARLRDQEIEVAAGSSALVEAAARPCDRLVAAIVGSAGVASTLAAVEAGNDVALANKESLISAGSLIMSTAEKHGARIVPMDSEHSAIFQVLSGPESVEKLILTASGGPFRTTPLEKMRQMTVQDARNHPKWSMGLKISIDSATLFNKALEVMEAAFLFEMGADDIDVVVHPQAIIHSMVAYTDGSVLAQLGEPDMRTPIAFALSWPDHRLKTDVKRLDLAKIARLDFEEVDHDRFPAISLAKRALKAGGATPLVLNSANEAAVAAFIAGECGFMDISSTVLETLEHFDANGLAGTVPACLSDVRGIDSEVRAVAAEHLRRLTAQRH
ncbi:MAG: 1-deoxy-D-xylulose-5-phosphate reductoisomerase [Pseudomonadota bacterium]